MLKNRIWVNHSFLQVVLGSLHSLTPLLSFVVASHSHTESWTPVDRQVQKFHYFHKRGDFFWQVGKKYCFQFSERDVGNQDVGGGCLWVPSDRFLVIIWYDMRSQCACSGKKYPETIFHSGNVGGLMVVLVSWMRGKRVGWLLPSDPLIRARARCQM